jgi:Transposase DDE domain
VADPTPPAPARPLAAALAQLDHADALPFEPLLSEQAVRQAFRDHGQPFRNCLYNPAVTLWLFLSQCLDAAQCLRKAVARFLAFRSARGLPPASADPSGYNKARHRLPEPVLRDLTRRTGRATEAQAEVAWLWLGRRVRVVDGTTCSMPDTPDNQEHYPQPRSQKPGLGFPLLRLLVIFSLAVGTVLEAALAPYHGKGTGETALFWQLLDTIEPADIVLGDRYFCTYWLLAGLKRREADGVFRLHAGRSHDLRRGLRIGREDRWQCWHRPARPEWMSDAEYAAMPPWLVVRVFRVHVRRLGFRTRAVVVATTLVDEEAYPKAAVGALYRRRWEAEPTLRSLKQTIHLDVLRGHSAAVVRLEVWAHLLAYNLVRGVMARAARRAQLDPARVSFAGAVQTLLEYLPQLLTVAVLERERLWREMEAAIGQHRVGDRPDRYEPRQVKRRPKQYGRLMRPRAEARKRLARSASA